MRLVLWGVLGLITAVFISQSIDKLTDKSTDKLIDVSIKKNVPRKIIYILTTSWYGSKFHGRTTANGDIYDMYKNTAAHRTFPFGRKLKLTNPENNKEVTVVINDRGPYDPKYLRNGQRKLMPHPDRHLDISFQAAKELGMVDEGVTDLFVEIIGP